MNKMNIYYKYYSLKRFINGSVVIEIPRFFLSMLNALFAQV